MNQIYYDIGRIFNLLFDFEAINLEDTQVAGLDDDVYLRPIDPKTMSLAEHANGGWVSANPHPRVQDHVGNSSVPHNGGDKDDKDNMDVNNVTDNSNSTNNETYVAPRQGGSDAPQSFSDIENIDWTFGLKDELPGLKYLFTIDGPFSFVRGLINGSQMTKDENMYMCDKIVAEDLVLNVQQLVNLTETMFQEEDFYKSVFILFDDLLLVAKITQKLHPIVFHCWNGGETVYNHYFDIIVNKNGYSPKSYLMNIVYNFGFIFDAAREFSLFFI
jgi:hypothetical protein